MKYTPVVELPLDNDTKSEILFDEALNKAYETAEIHNINSDEVVLAAPNLDSFGFTFDEVSQICADDVYSDDVSMCDIYDKCVKECHIVYGEQEFLYFISVLALREIKSELN